MQIATYQRNTILEIIERLSSRLFWSTYKFKALIWVGTQWKLTLNNCQAVASHSLSSEK